MEPPVNDNQRLPTELQHSQSAVLVGKPQRAGTGPPPGQGDSPLAPLWVDSPPHQLGDIPMVGSLLVLGPAGNLALMLGGSPLLLGLGDNPQPQGQGDILRGQVDSPQEPADNLADLVGSQAHWDILDIHPVAEEGTENTHTHNQIISDEHGNRHGKLELKFSPED